MAQHDYTIDNDTGLAVRLDIQDAVQALASNSAGALEPTTTYAYMPWADTANDIMKMRNAANTGWLDLYVLSTGVSLVAGSSLSFTTSQSGSLVSFDVWLAEGGNTRALPTAPQNNDEIIIIDDKGVADTTNIIVGRGGKLIQGLAEDLIINVNFARVHLKYLTSLGDWRIISA